MSPVRRGPLSPAEMQKARSRFALFAVLNVISFVLLSGNIVTLYALRLGAGNFLVGLLYSFMYTAYLCMLIGRLIAPRWGMTRLMGRFWLLRYLMMLPMLASPFLAARGYTHGAFALIIFSVLGFNAARGVAITGYNPILGVVAAEKDRGAFLARLQVAQHAVTLALGVGMAVVLGRGAPLYVYAVFIIAGVAAGLAAASIIFRLPEPAETAGRSGAASASWKDLVQALGHRAFRRFIVVYFLSTLAIYMAAPFLVVYMTRVSSQPDNYVLFYAVFGSAGAVLMAVVSGFLIDRLGAKPLYFVFTVILAVVLVPTAVAPPLGSQLRVWLFGAAVFVFFNMGQFGILNAGQTYFLAAIKPEDRLNLGVVYYLALGAAGGIGSALGGALLEALGSGSPQTALPAFRIYFGAVAALLAVLLFFTNSLESLGAYSIKDALAAIFTPRDLRAISLLNRLDRSRSMSEERSTLRALAESHSELSVQEVLWRLRSPRFTIRAEALQALNSLPLDEAAIQELISEVKNHAYTTAYLAADIMGNRGVRQGISALRRSLHGKDFFLAGKAMVALAQLGDRESLPAIRGIVARTNNPRLIIHGARALEIYRDAASLPVMLAALRRPGQPFVRDEIILAMAEILGMGQWFYPKYVDFLARGSTGVSLLEDHVAAGEHPRIPRQLLAELLRRLPQRNHALFGALAAELLETVPIRCEGVDASAVLRQAVLSPQTARLERLLFLVAAAIVWYAFVPGGARQPPQG
jgi:predicted MFS family arabinose efflux permease